MADQHDPKVLVKSQVFTAINRLIDRNMNALLDYQNALEINMERLLTPKYHADSRISVRVSYEERGREERPLPYPMHELKRLAEIIQSAQAAEAMISELQRHKLRLLNDYDFTHGDPTEQIAVFGPSPAD